PAVPLTSRSIVDLSHESLMRCWQRLVDWAAAERAAAEFYMRLARAAAWHEEGRGGGGRNPGLQRALQWQRDNAITPAWARRYDDSFDRAMAFLERCLEARRQHDAQIDRERKARLRRAQGTAAVLGTFLIVASVLALLAWRENRRAARN